MRKLVEHRGFWLRLPLSLETSTVFTRMSLPCANPHSGFPTSNNMESLFVGCLILFLSGNLSLDLIYGPRSDEHPVGPTLRGCWQVSWWTSDKFPDFGISLNYWFVFCAVCLMHSCFWKEAFLVSISHTLIWKRNTRQVELPSDSVDQVVSACLCMEEASTWFSVSILLLTSNLSHDGQIISCFTMFNFGFCH